MQHLQPNTTLQGGKYRIERVLGQGGFGITYLAVQTSLKRQVAIKEFFMKDSCSHDEATLSMLTSSIGGTKQVEQYKRKFIKEARNLARLNHPNIISVIDVFEEYDTVYYVMPYLAGGSLQDYVKSHGALSESEAMKYVKQVAKALKYMHKEQHMCHFDVKPANILLDDNGNAVLIDFGISKNYDTLGHETTTTPVGISEGYAPIEQYQQNVEEFSPASDVYALGATLYFLLHGKRPVSAVHRASGTALLTSKHLSQGIKDIINSSMKISKCERANSVDVFMGNSSYQKVSSHERDMYKKNSNSLIPIIVLIALILGGVLGYHLYQKRKTQIIIDNIVNNMVYVKGGTFKMGHDDDRKPSDTYFPYGPVHTVTLSSFYIGKYEVTQEEWEKVMGFNPSLHIGAKLPVERVTWAEAKQFVEKLSSITGKVFRLPTEAEWEYAARGGIKSNNYLFSGSNNYDDVAWCKSNSRETTREVGMKSPNELGIYDMSGNVIEWCQDYLESYNASPQQDPLCSEYDPSISLVSVVCRGGCVGSDARDCRVYIRESRYTTSGIYQRYYVGLRIVCTKM